MSSGSTTGDTETMADDRLEHVKRAVVDAVQTCCIDSAKSVNCATAALHQAGMRQIPNGYVGTAYHDEMRRVVMVESIRRLGTAFSDAQRDYDELRAADSAGNDQRSAALVDAICAVSDKHLIDVWTLACWRDDGNGVIRRFHRLAVKRLMKAIKREEDSR